MEGADVAKCIEQLVALYNAVGFWGAAVLLGITVGGPVLGGWLRDQRLEKAFEATIVSKDEAIERLAADNRKWRDHFFKQRGTSEEEMMSRKKKSPKQPEDKK